MLKNPRVVTIWRFMAAGIFLPVFYFAIARLILPGRAASVTASSGYYQTAMLAAEDMGEGDLFGQSVAISGDTAIVGAPQDDDFGSNAGSAYVFVFDPGERAWNQVAKLHAHDPGSYHQFGMSVAISGDTAFVSAPTHSPGGLVYVFERNQGGADAWGEARQILGDEVTWGDYFGISMDISGDLLVVGAYAGGDYDGSVYVFERDQGGPDTWGQVARLVPADNPAYNYFGYSVAISGMTVVGGAPGHDGVIGAAYVFERQANQNWLEVAQLVPGDGAYQDFFGIAVDVDGDTFAAGSPGNEEAGAVYLHERNQGGQDAWEQSAKLLASDGALGDDFGQDVLIDGDLVFAGATGFQESAGAIYAYARQPGGAWEEAFQLVAGEPAPGEALGNALASDGLILLAGASMAAPGGAAYVYTAYSPPAAINLVLAPDPVPEGAEALLTGSFSDPDPGESHGLSVQWGDGSTTANTLPPATLAFTLTHTYQDDRPSGTPADPYTLTVAITDTHGGTAWTQLPLVVENIPPTILPGADIQLRAGDSLQLWGVFTDPGADAWAGWVDYGDGSTPLPLDIAGQAFWLDHHYLLPGIFEVYVTIRDDDAGQDASQFMVRVADPVYLFYLSMVQR